MKYSDSELIERTLEGDQSAFAALVEKYQEQVHTLAWQKIGDFHIAQEITQDTFLTAYQKLSTLKDHKRFAGWLYVIANRKCIAWHRSKNPQSQSLEELKSVELDKVFYTEYIARQREEAANEKRRETVQNLLSTLRESDRTVVTLYYIAEMSCEEIAKFLGVSPNAVRTRLHRARKRLKEEIAQIEENLGSFELPTLLLDRIMENISTLSPNTSPASKPTIPFAAFAASAILVILLMGFGAQYLHRFQRPYNLEAQSEPTIEIVEAQHVFDTQAKQAMRPRIGGSEFSGKGSGTKTQSAAPLYAVVDTDVSGNSAEGYMVKLVHFLPKNRSPQQGIDAKIDELVKRTQKFYADQMESYGYGRKTFTYETDVNGNAKVHHITGKHSEANYRKYPGSCFDEFAHSIQTSNTILLTFIDLGKHGGSIAYSGRRVLIPASNNHFNRFSVAHHLGYALGLPHDPRDGSYLMSYGPGTQNRISEDAARWLNVNPYFNPTNRIEANKRGQIKPLPPIAYPPDNMHVFYEANDPDGLYQIRFMHGYTVMHSGKSLSGESASVELRTETVKMNRAFVQTVDVNGGITWGGWYSFNEMEPYMVLDISPEISGVDNSLIGYWTFDEAKGEFAYDASGNSSYARLSDGANLAFNGGKIGGALQLDGSKESATIRKGGDFINGLRAFTLSFWVKSNKFNTDRGFIFPKIPNGKDEIFCMRYDAEGVSGGGKNVIKASITTTGGVQTYESASGVQTTEWQHLTLTWQTGRKLTLYINGVLDQPTFNNDPTAGEITGVDRLLIGRGSNDRNSSWDGLIDEVRLYNRVLSVREIEDLSYVADRANPFHNRFHGVALTGMCDVTSETIKADADIEYILTVTNTGNVQDTINLAISEDVDAALSSTSVSLAPGVSSKITLTVPGVVRTTVGDYIVKVTATSGEDSTKTAQITTTISIPPIYGVDLAGVGNLASETTVNTDVTYIFIVTNNGNVADTIRLTTSDTTIATLSQKSVSLAPGVSSTVSLNIAGAAPDTTANYWVKVIATSENDNTKTDQIRTITRVHSNATHLKSLQDSLLIHWNFDEAGEMLVADVSENSSNTIDLWEPTAGKIGGALRLDGNDSLTIVNAENLINGLESFTIAFWVKSANIHTNSGFIFPKVPNGKDEIFSLRYDAEGYHGGGTDLIKASITTTDGEQVYESASNVQTTEWQHIALTWRSGGELTLFINGVLDQPTFNSEATQGEITGADRLLIGRGGKDINGSWKGLIDDVRLYDRVLSPKEIANLFDVTTTRSEALGSHAILK